MAALPLLLPACGSSVESEPAAAAGGELPGIVAGTRLRPRVAIAGDAHAFMGWYDSELGVECLVGNAPDGTRRCMPIRWQVGFLGPDCTEPVIAVRCLKDGDYYGALRGRFDDPCGPFVSTGDPPSYMYRRAGDAIEGSAYYYASVENGEIVCSETPTALAGYETLVPAEPMPPEAFVEVTETIEPGEGRLAVRWMVATDGAREALGPYDTELEDECHPHPRWGDSRACVPLHREVAWGYVDPGCTELAVTSSCAPPPAALVDTGACAFDLYARGARADVLYSEAEGMCAPYATGASVFGVGPLLAPDDLPAVEFVMSGTGRIRSRRLVDGQGAALSADGQVWPALAALWDVELGSPCYPGEVPGVGWVCAPAAEVQGQVFADADCTERAVLSYCGATDFWVRGLSGEPALPDKYMCDAYTFDLRRPAEELNEAFELTDAGCVPLVLEEEYRPYRAGSPLDPMSLAPATSAIW